jgi:hypothetical protein
MRLHLVTSLTESGEIRSEYLGPDRLAALAAYSTPAPGSVRASLYSFLEVTASKAVEIATEIEKPKFKK